MPSIRRLGDCIIANLAAVLSSNLFVLGLIAIAIIVALVESRRVKSLSAEVKTLRDQASRVDTLEQELATRRDRLRQTRHDIRGALSPALLASDRLLDHADPAVKRSAEIVVRSVDRAIVLLADTPEASAPNPPADS